MKKSTFLFIVLLIVIGKSSLKAQETTNTEFDTYKKGFLDKYWKLYPNWATLIGYHKYDSILTIPDSAQREKELKFIDKELKSLKAFNYQNLSNLNKIDFKLIETQLQQRQWEINELKAYEWNPSIYNVGEIFGYILSENYEPLDKRIKNISKLLDHVNEYYDSARSTIKNPSPEHLQLAIEQNQGSLSIFEKDLTDSIGQLKIDVKEKMNLFKKARKAANIIYSYISFLKDLKPENPRSFRLGKELYEKKFFFEIQSHFSSDQIYDAALERKEYLHHEMEKISKELWPKYFDKQPMPENRLVLIKKVIDTISIQHVKTEDFRPYIEQQLPELAKFVKEKNILYLDPSKPLKVRQEPGYMAGVAGASMSAPGPYEKNGTAYYNVGTLDGWNTEKAESYLREYNKYTLQILNIHEAIPGHYAQLVYSNQSPSLIKSVFQNSTMIEGWAVYSELMMLENGYGNDDPEMWLFYYKWNLRSTCNTILDISVHTRNMSEEQAMDLLINQAFQQKTEAEGKWHRVQVTNVQLCCYFTGFKEILDLREEYKQLKGPAYNLKSFNEKFLSYGSAPVKYIHDLLLLRDEQ